MTALRRVAALLATILRPWWVGVAALGGLAAVFPEPGPGGVSSAKGQFAIQSWDWPHPRQVMFRWNCRDGADRTAEWSEDGGRPLWGIRWTVGGTVPEDLLWLVGRGLGRRGATLVVRPAGVTPEYVRTNVSVWYWFGFPAVWSAVAVWSLIRSWRAAENEAAAPRDGTAWRLVRPWAWMFGCVGAAVLWSGGAGWSTTPDEFGMHTTVDLTLSEASPDYLATRSIAVQTVQYRVADREETGSGPVSEARRWGTWPLLVGLYAYDEPLQLMREWEADLAAEGRVLPANLRDGVFTLSSSVFALSVWWLVAPPLAFNLVTLVRLSRGRRGKSAVAAG